MWLLWISFVVLMILTDAIGGLIGSFFCYILIIGPGKNALKRDGASFFGVVDGVTRGTAVVHIGFRLLVLALVAELAWVTVDLSRSNWSMTTIGTKGDAFTPWVAWVIFGVYALRTAIKLFEDGGAIFMPSVFRDRTAYILE